MVKRILDEDLELDLDLDLDMDLDINESSGASLTKKYEGFRSKVYKDTVGKKTIGYGFNLEDPYTASLIPQDIKEGKRELTEEEATPIFNKRYSQAEADRKTYLGEDLDKRLSQPIKDVVTDLSYNMGLSKLSKFSGFKKALEESDYERAALELQYINPDAKEKIETPWYSQVGDRAKEHIERLRGEKPQTSDISVLRELTPEMEAVCLALPYSL